MADEFIVECFHPYEAEKDDELTLQVGDRLRVSDRSDPGWWIGERLSDGKTGWFPSNFVNPVESSTETSAQTSEEPQVAAAATIAAPPAAAAVTDAVQDAPAPAEEASVPPKETGPILARVEYDYEPKVPGELSLEVGRVITILDRSDAAWWKGDCNGKIGVFPSNYVKLIEKDEAAEKAQKFKLAAFGVKQGGLGSLFAGGVVPGLKKTGGLRKTGIDVTTGKRTSMDEPRSPVAAAPAVPKAAPLTHPGPAHVHAPAPAHALPLAPTPAQEPVAAPTPAPAPAHVAAPAPTPAPVAAPTPTPIPAPAPVPAPVAPSSSEETASPSLAEPRVPSRAKKPKAKQTKAVVMYDYTAQEDDEISLVKGATIVITDRMGDEGWWAGRDEHGNAGNFPSDFVQLLAEESSVPTTPAMPAPAVPLPTPADHVPAPAPAPAPAVAPEPSSPKVAAPPPLPLHAPVPVPISTQPMTAASPTDVQRPELPRTRTNDSVRAVPPPIPKSSRPPSMIASPSPSSPRLAEQRPLQEAPPPLPSSPPPKRTTSRSNSIDQAGSPRTASRPPSVVLPAVPSPEPISESLSRSSTAGRHPRPIPEAPVEEEQQEEEEQESHAAEPNVTSSNRSSYILPSPVARNRPLPPLARPPSIHQENRRSLVISAAPTEAEEVHHDLQKLSEEKEDEDEDVKVTGVATDEETQEHTKPIHEHHPHHEEEPIDDLEHPIKGNDEIIKKEDENKEEHHEPATGTHDVTEESAEQTHEKAVERVEATPAEPEAIAEADAHVEVEPMPASEPEKPSLPEISASGPTLSHASRPRPAKGRKLPSVPIPSQEESFSAKLEAEVKAAPILEEPKKEEQAPAAAVTPEKPGPPPKPMKPIFGKFPTPFAGAQPAAVALRPTGRRESNEPHPGGTSPVSASSPSPSAGSTAGSASAATTTTPPVGGVKSLSSRFNQFQGVPSGGNTGHLELELAKLKRIMNEELDRIRRELSEEREKREQLEAEVKELKQQLSSA